MRSSSATTMPSTSASCTRVLLRLHLGGHRTARSLAARVGVEHRAVVEELDHALEVGFLADGQLQRRDARAELVLQLVERARERRTLAVELVHEDRSREPQIRGHAPRGLGLHLDALDGGHHEEDEVGGPQCGGDVAHEVGVAGGVEDVDLVALVLERRDTERHRDRAPRFLRVEVGRGRAVLDAALSWDGAGDEQQGLGERCLPGPAVSHHGDVA